jgi:hypothetical protein
MLDDWNMKSQADDEEKHLFQFYFVGILVLLSRIVVTLQRIFSRKYTKNFIFLIPVFHQSNYVILFPSLISKNLQ